MASKSQSPGPTSQPKQARSRKAAVPPEQSIGGRAGSAGGIVLEKEKALKAKGTPVTSGTVKSDTVPLVKEDATTAAAASTGPNRQRRRPRKLNKEPALDQNTQASSTQQSSTSELEALKSRVRGLEAKVEELYKAAESRLDRSPRRRGKGRKSSSSTQVPTTSSTTEPSPPNDEEVVDEELVRLEGELAVARHDLESYRPHTRPRTRRATSGDTEYVEEIPRNDIGATETELDTGDRQVTLSGSYRIPLPSSVSMTDVKNIQNGVSAAQNVAKSFLEQRRAAQAVRNPTSSSTSAGPSRPNAARKDSGGLEVSKEGQSWGEWIGGYSMAISRAVKNIEAEAAIESQKAARPTQAGRRASAPGTGPGKKTAKGGRPGMKSRQGNLSSEQVSGLMS